MENPLIDWINNDKKLNALLTEIESTGKNPREQAEIGFDKLAELYNIPKMPNDVPDDAENGISLFEEHALIKFLEDEKASI